MEKKYVAYFRVSTDKQGIKGLGISAQKKMVTDYIKCNDCVIGEFTEVESGKKNNRIELMKAIDLCKKQNAILVIAKLDRLSRNVNFITSLMESSVKFICTDMPDANDFTIHIFAAMAEQERKFISSRTKAALDAKKRRGEPLGNINNFSASTRALGSKGMINKAKSNINNVLASGYIKALKDNGKTLQEIADILNKEGFKTSTGKEFYPMQVQRLAK